MASTGSLVDLQSATSALFQFIPQWDSRDVAEHSYNRLLFIDQSGVSNHVNKIIQTMTSGIKDVLTAKYSNFPIQLLLENPANCMKIGKPLLWPVQMKHSTM